MLESKPPIDVIPASERRSPKEVRVEKLNQALERVKTALQSKEYETLLSELENPHSALTETLQEIDVELLFNVPELPTLLRKVTTITDPLSRHAEQLYRALTSGTGPYSFPDTGQILFYFYAPNDELWQELEKYCASAVLQELKKTILLVLAEELAHTIQNIEGRNEIGQFFISDEMKTRPAPPVGPLRKRLIELDDVLYLVQMGYGPHMQQSLWLLTHEREYGETLAISEGMKVELSEESKQWFE